MEGLSCNVGFDVCVFDLVGDIKVSDVYACHCMIHDPEQKKAFIDHRFTIRPPFEAQEALLIIHSCIEHKHCAILALEMFACVYNLTMSYPVILDLPSATPADSIIPVKTGKNDCHVGVGFRFDYDHQITFLYNEFIKVFPLADILDDKKEASGLVWESFRKSVKETLMILRYKSDYKFIQDLYDFFEDKIAVE